VAARKKVRFDIEAQDKTGRAFDAVGRRLNGMRRGLGGLRSAIGAVAGVGAAAGGFAYLAKKSLDAADAIAKAADVIGVSTDTLQEFHHVADLSGVSTEALDKGLKQFGKTIGEAQAGTGTLTYLLNKMNPALLQQLQATQSVDQALDVYLTAMARAGSQTDKLAMASAAFGRAGKDMTVMVKGGTSGLRSMRQEAHTLGRVIEDDLLRNAERTKDQLTTLARVIRAQVTAAVVELTPKIGDLAERFTHQIPKIVEVIDKIGTAVGVFAPSRAEQMAKLAATINDLNAELAVTADIFPESILDPEGAKALMFKRMDLEVLTDEYNRLADAMRNAATAGKVGGGAPPPSPPRTPPEFDRLGFFGAQARQQEKDREAAFARGREIIEAEKEKRAAIAASTAEMARQNNQLVRLMVSHQHGTAAVQAMTEIIEIENMAMAEGVDVTTQAGEAWYAAARQGQILRDEMDRVKMATELQADIFDRFGQGVLDATLRASEGMEGLRNVALAVAQDLYRTFMMLAVLNPIKNSLFNLGLPTLEDTLAESVGAGGTPGTSAGVFPEFQGYGGLKGSRFARGGSFTVSGSGGTDSQVVGFRATPGEEVIVRTRAQQQAAGGGGVHIGVLDARGADRVGLARLENMIMKLHGSIEQRAVAAVVNERTRDDWLFGASGV